jgi:hypothetical protein
MKIAGGIIGIIGGLIALIIGTVGFGLTSAGNAMNQATGGGAIFAGFQYAALIIPIAALVGAGMSFSKARLGAIIMVLSALFLVLIFGFHTVSLIPVVLLGVGAFLAFMSEASPSNSRSVTMQAAAVSTASGSNRDVAIGEIHSVFKGKKIIKEAEGVSVDGVPYANAVKAQIAITNGEHS